jgi:HlyD family secretion protein
MRRALWIAVLLVVVGLVGFGLWVFLGSAKETVYTTVPVSRGKIIQTVSASGTLQAVVTVQVGSQVSGTIAKLYADYNSRVKAGQVIAELDQGKFKARVEEARANLVSSQADLAKAKVALEDTEKTLARTTALKKQDLISQSELDAAETSQRAALAQIDVAKGRVEQAKAGLDQAALDLSYTIIRSPVNGIVISRNVDVGQTVAASLQAPTLFTIANDLSKMEVHTNVAEADIGSVWDKQEVTFNVDAYATRRFRGMVAQVRNAPMVVQNVVTYDAVVRIDNKELLLRPGMTANVQFLVSQKDGVLKVPNLAIRFRLPTEKPDSRPRAVEGRGNQAGGGSREGSRGSGGGRRASRNRENGGRGSGREGQGAADAGRWARLYILKDQKPVPVRVRLGITDGSATAVLEGELREGQQVIVAMSENTTANTSAGVVNPFRTRGFGRGLR